MMSIYKSPIFLICVVATGVLTVGLPVVVGLLMLGMQLAQLVTG